MRRRVFLIGFLGTFFALDRFSFSRARIVVRDGWLLDARDLGEDRG